MTPDLLRISSIHAQWARNLFGDEWVNRKLAYGQISILPIRKPNPIEYVLIVIVETFIKTFYPLSGELT